MKELDEIRGLPLLKEKSLGLFYFKSTPFLHFHDADGERWADVKKDDKWVNVPISFLASKKERQSFVKAVKLAHKQLMSAKGP